MPETYDLSKAMVGFISGFYEGGGRTGYQVEMLIRGEERVFDAHKQAYDFRDTTEFFPYPCLGEVLFMPQFDNYGLLTHFVNVNNIADAGNPVKTGLVMGTYAMFQKKITEDTPTFGQILRIDGDTVTLFDYDRFKADGSIFSSTHGGAMPEPRDGMSFRLAHDTVFHLWDWGEALTPFCKCSREEAEANRFVTRFSIGKAEDHAKCYWIGFYSTRGDETVCDLVKCFWNKPPGWM